MSQIPQPLPVPAAYTRHIAEEDITASLRLTPGVYTAASLYAYYRDLVLAAGGQPASANRYGRALRRLGYTATFDTTGNRRCWIIPAS